MAGLSRQDCFALPAKSISIPGRVGSRQDMSAAPCAALFVSALLSVPLLYGVDIICLLPFVFFYFLPGHYMRKYKIGFKKLGLRAKDKYGVLQTFRTWTGLYCQGSSSFYQFQNKI